MDNPQRKYGVYPIIHHKVLNDDLIEKNDKDGFAELLQISNIAGDLMLMIRYGQKQRKTSENTLYIWLYDEGGYPSGVADI